MINLFEGLEKFGFKNLKDVEVFEKKEVSTRGQTPVKKQFIMKDYIYAKSFTCPACNEDFNANIVRTGKLQLISIDYDLRPVYEPFDPLLYDVILCPHCGYAAIKQKFHILSDSQAQMIQEKITPQFQFVAYPDELDVDMAIERYKLSLLNTVVKRGKAGEKAYICMKTAWLFRGKKDKTNEMALIKYAYDGFESAFVNETPPICGLEENTIIYLLAAFAKTLGMYEESLKYLSKLIVSRTTTGRLKDRALDLRDDIKRERENELKK